MSTTALEKLLADPALACSTRVDAQQRDDCARAAIAAGLQVMVVDCAGLSHRDEVLARFAAALRFPDYFGGNWDALLDCITDLSWWPGTGYVLLVDGSQAWREAEPEAFAALFEILQVAASRWADSGVPFWSLFVGESAGPGDRTPAADVVAA